MCSNPITITRKNKVTGQTRSYVVPCGKCAECARKKQAEFNALAFHQALQSGMVHMFTFTYRSDQCPVALSVLTPEGVPQIVGFGRGDSPFLCSGNFLNGCLAGPGNLKCAASLRREDVKLVLKEFRTLWKKRFTDPLEFKYAIFGEYGERHGRPHYHGLFFGLSLRQAEFLRTLWESRFGFAHFGPCSENISMDDVKKITSYASKYISKGVHSRWDFLTGYVEPPRRQSSLNFGDFTESELDALRGFMMGAIFVLHSPEPMASLSSALYYLDARLFEYLNPRTLFLSV